MGAHRGEVSDVIFPTGVMVWGEELYVSITGRPIKELARAPLRALLDWPLRTGRELRT